MRKLLNYIMLGTMSNLIDIILQIINEEENNGEFISFLPAYDCDINFQFNYTILHVFKFFSKVWTVKNFWWELFPFELFPCFSWTLCLKKKKLTALEKMHGHNCLSNKSFAIIEVWREKNVLKIQILPANCFSIPNLPAN